MNISIEHILGCATWVVLYVGIGVVNLAIAASDEDEEGNND